MTKGADFRDAARAFGRMGGLARSEAKARAARENGRKGGRPKLPKPKRKGRKP